ncbi:MAG: aminoacyl-tRNA hydrolase [Methylococcales bacterium]|jgi:peptidyl-tRNA hydrolase, PTH1 family|nr:aminoacyl-tRNA hydrolase [Methylococcales bacterium]MBT7408775.1 aminoacyl-tRNA hydrolase [Methylococcales bacterium]
MASTSPLIQLIVGLGNPGIKYEKTRHNAGFWFIDSLAKKHSCRIESDKKFLSDVGKVLINGAQCWLLKPTTFMNNSGQAVSLFCHYYKINAESVLVVHDELDFPAGKIRIKSGGGHGGHNGLRDIQKALNSSDYLRCRVGIDHPGDRSKVLDYVLGCPGKDDAIGISIAIDHVINEIEDLVDSKSRQKAIHKIHSAT